MKELVVIVCPQLKNGGAEVVARSIVKNRTKCEKVGLFFNLGLEKKEKVNPHEVVFGLRHHNPLNVIFLFYSILFFRFRMGYKKIYISAHLSWAFYYCAPLSLLSFCELYYTEHHLDNKRRRLWAFRLIDQLVYLRYRNIICISEAVKNSLVAWQPRIKSRVLVIYNGIVAQTSILSDEIRLRTQKKEEYNLVYFGRIIRSKNIEIVLHAIASSQFQFTLTIVGEGAHRRNLEVLVKKLNLTERVFFTGGKAITQEYLGGFDCVVNPSIVEGFGLAFLEGLSLHGAVLASDIAAYREICVVAGVPISLVDPSESRSWAENLEKLAEAGFPRLDVAKRSAIIKRFSVWEMVSEYERLLLGVG